MSSIGIEASSKCNSCCGALQNCYTPSSCVLCVEEALGIIRNGRCSARHTWLDNPSRPPWPDGEISRGHRRWWAMEVGAGTGDAVDRWARDRAGGVARIRGCLSKIRQRRWNARLCSEMGDGRNACKVGQKSEKLKVDNKLSSQQQQQAARPPHCTVWWGSSARANIPQLSVLAVAASLNSPTAAEGQRLSDPFLRVHGMEERRPFQVDIKHEAVVNSSLEVAECSLLFFPATTQHCMATSSSLTVSTLLDTTAVHPYPNGTLSTKNTAETPHAALCSQP